MIDQKADIADLEKICNILELKVDQGEYDRQLRQIREQFTPIGYLDSLRDQLRLKADKQDHESLASKLLDCRVDVDRINTQISSDLQTLEQDIFASQDQLRQSVHELIRLKADQSAVERLQSQVMSKCDAEYLQSLVTKLK